MTSPRGYDAGTAFLAVIPSFRGVQKAIEREVRGIERSLGKEAGKEFGKNFEEGTNNAVDRVLGTDTVKKAAAKSGNAAGRAYAGAFSEQLKKAVGDAQREVRASIKLTEDKEFERSLREISNELNKLSKAKIGLNMDADAALGSVQAVRARITELQQEAARVDLSFNTATAQTSLQRIEAQIKKLDGINITVEPVLDDRQMGYFEKGLKKRLEAATRNIAPIKFDADVTPAQNRVQQLRHELATLSDKRIGVDIAGSAALAEMERIRAALADIKGDSDVDIQVRADAAAAATELAAINTLVELVDGKKVEVKVEVDSDTAVGKMAAFRKVLLGADHQGLEAANSFRSFNAVILAGAAILPGLVPVLGAAAGALALIGPLAVGAAAGMGTLIFAFSGIGDAVKALGNQRENGAREAVASARTMRDASAGVAEAERGVAEARSSAARASADAARAVSDAVDTQRDAERDLVATQSEVVQAQEDVNRAREEARERIEDLALSIRGGALAEREAILDLKEAQKAFDEGVAGGASGDAREQLLIDLEQAKLRVDSLRESNADMASEQAEFNRTGVEGSAEVQSAQERVAAAQEAVRAATERVADASEGVQDALRAQQQTNADNTAAIQGSQRALTEAQQRYTDALYDTGVTGKASAQAVQEAFAKLGPAGQLFALYIDSIRGDMRDLRDEVQAGLFPGLQDAIDDILVTNGPLLHKFMRDMGQTLGNIFRDFGELMTSPQWQAIWLSVTQYAPTFMQQFAQIGGSLLTILGELFRGLAPWAERFGGSLVDMADAAADWAHEWVDSKEFQDVMEWLFTYGPIIFEHLWSILQAAGALLIALGPLGEIVLGIVGNIADFIAEMDPKVLGAIVTTILGLVIAFQLAHGAVALLTGAAAIMASPLSKMVFFFGAAATALAILYTQSEDVREFFHWLVGIIGDLVGWFTDLPGVIQAVALGFGALILLRGPLGGVLTGIKSFAETAALKMLYARDATGQFGTKMGGLGGPASVARKGLGGLTGFLGGPWALAIGGAVIGLGFLVDWLDTSGEAAANAEQYQKDLATALRDSKGAIDENIRAMAAQAAADQEIGDSNMLRVAQDLGIELPKLTDALLGNDAAYRQIRDSLTAIFDESLKAENAGNLEWTEKGENARLLLEALDALAPSMGLAREDAGLLADAQGGAAAQTARLNDELAEEAGLLVTLAEANIGSQEAAHNLAEAHSKLADVLADENASEEDIYNARQAIINQAQASYRAAVRVAEARHADAEGAEAQHYANAAILADLNAQKLLYGDLPPELENLRQGLLDTVPASFLAATEMENLGITITGVPDEKTITIEAPTAEQKERLEDLGFVVTTMPDGTVTVTAETDAAQEALDKLDTDRFITITAGVEWERATTLNAPREYGGANFGSAGHAQGGPIYGPGGPTADVIPILASNGEYMIKAAAVRKYGLDFMDMINAGRYADGGLVGRQRFAGGGLVASWGGSIALTKGDANPLALIWMDAIQAINAVAQAGSNMVAAHFAKMRDTVLITTRDLRARTMREWNPFMLGLVTSTNTMRAAVSLLASRLSLDVTLAFSRMRISSVGAANQLAGGVATHFARLPRSTALPVNTVIDRVLNRGLFAAFNHILLELGLNKEWSISGAKGVQLTQTAAGGTRLAAGGRVPGWSPHDKADNIPAYLTAGEWVQPVDAVNYYGPEFMEDIRKRRFPREMAQKRATGGQIFALTQSVFPRAKLNSSYRPGDPGYHGRNMAADLGEAGFAGGIGRAYIAAMKRWWVDNFGRTTNEIIYNGLGNDRPNIKDGQSYPYSAGTQAEHRNHLHVAVAGALGVKSGAPDFSGLGGAVIIAPPAWYSKYGGAEGVLKALEASIDPGQAALAPYGKPGKIYSSMGDKAVDWVWSKIEGSVESLFAGIAGALAGAIAPASGKTGPVVDIVRSVASKYGWGDGNEWNALAQLITKESSWNPTAQNPTSTAYGLFQFLNGTWAGVGASKTSDPGLQTEAGLRYIRGRYGSPSQALAFHLANNWYGDGGEVGGPSGSTAEASPVLYDAGGWLPPGVSTVLNATNKPEPILTAEQWRELTSSSDDTGPSQVIGALHLHQVNSNLEDAVAEVNHWGKVYSNGGRYAEAGSGR